MSERDLTPAEMLELSWRLKRMQRDWQDKVTECKGKAQFHSREAAIASISRRLRGKVHPYHCDICRGWHIGNSTHVFRKKKAFRRILTKRREQECE